MSDSMPFPGAGQALCASNPPEIVVHITPAHAGGHPHPLLIFVGGQWCPQPPETLLDDAIFQELIGNCAGNSEPAVDIRHLPEWSMDVISAVVRFVVGLGPTCRIVDGHNRQHHNLLSGMLVLLDRPDEIGRFGKLLVATKYAAALLFGDDPNTAANQIVSRLRVLGQRGHRVAGVVRDIQRLRAVPEARPDCQPMLVSAVLPDAPITGDLVVPPGWELSAAGINRSTIGTRGPFAEIPAPVLVTARGRNVCEGVEHVTVAWQTRGQWHQRNVPCEQAATTRTIVGLAQFGLPVTSVNAETLVEYISDYSAANENLPSYEITNQLGWCVGHEPDAFLLGA